MTTLGKYSNSHERYEICSDEPVAVGGQGQLFHAVDLLFDRPVLIKKLRNDIATLPENRERFIREAEITAKLQHPGIVPVHDFFEDQSGSSCCVMEFVQDEGENERPRAQTFGDLLQTHTSSRNRFRDDEFLGLIRILIRIANTVSYAHHHGVIHRDIKCANVLVTNSRVVVIDWGVAKIIGEDDFAYTPSQKLQIPSDRDDPLTQVGDNIGTIPYSAPELSGNADAANERSDVYSLGIILYLVLTGRLPSKGAHPPIPPRRFNRSIPKPLEAVCLAAVAPDPLERYRNAGAFQNDLEHWLDDKSVSVYKDGFNECLWRYARRHRTQTSVALTLVAAILLGLLVLNRINAAKNQKLAEKNDALVEAAVENNALSAELSEQLSLMRSRQYSSTLREAGELLNNQDPGTARALIHDDDLCAKRLRDFTWRLLEKAGNDMHRFEKCDARPRHLVFEGRGKERSLVLGFSDGRVDVWRGRDFEERETKFRLSAPISSLALRRSGHHTRVAVGTRKGEIVVSDWNGRFLTKVRPHQSVVNLVGFEQSTGDLVTGDIEGHVNVWKVGAAEPKASHQISGEVLGYAYTGIRHRIAAGRRGGTVHTLDLGTGKQEPIHLNAIADWAGAITFFRNGERLAIGQRSGGVDVVVNDGEQEYHGGGEHQFESAVRYFSAFPIGKYDLIAAANHHDGVHISKPGRTGWIPLKVRGKRYYTCSLCLSNEGDMLAFGHRDSHLSLWNLKALEPKRLVHDGFDRSTGEINSFAWASNSKSVMWGTNHGTLFAAGLQLSQDDFKRPILKVVACEGIDRSVLVFDTGLIQVLDGATRASEKTYSTEFRNPIRDISCVSGGRLAVLSAEGFEILDASSLKVLKSIGLADIGRVNLTLAACSGEKAVIYTNQELICVDLHTEQLIWKVRFPDRRKVEQLLMFSSGQLFITCDRSGEVRLWSSDHGEEIRVLKTQAGPVMGIDISPDQRTVAILDRSGRIELIDSMLGSPRLTLHVPDSRMIGLSFSPDGESLAAATRTGIYVWSTE